MAREHSQRGPRPAAPEAQAKARKLPLQRPETIDDAAIKIHGEGYAPAAPGQPTLHEIAARAHEIYVARGATPGWELDDWLQAERELCFPGLRD